MTTAELNEIAWVDAERDYKLGLRHGKLVCQNPKAKTLSAVPKWLKETDTAEQMLALAEWLSEHDDECRHTVERWMLRSLSIPREVLVEVWQDPDWKKYLRDLVIVPADARGKFDREKCGLLRDVDAKRGLGVVDLDGESQWIKTACFAVVHPILIDDLEELRELAGDLKIKQTIDQLYRPIYAPTASQQSASQLSDYSGGHFEQLNFVNSLCRRLGYPVRGGHATCRVWENQAMVEARYFVGDEYPESETWTGDLSFTDTDGKGIKIKDVGPVTFSEGVRMASAIYAKRKVAESEDEQ